MEVNCLGCTTGSGELGAMGASKHDSIDNTDSFYGQPVKIAQTTPDVFFSLTKTHQIQQVKSKVHVRSYVDFGLH